MKVPMEHPLVSVLAGLLLPTLVLAQVPQTLSYQGLLTTSGGAPVRDSSYALTFKLYTTASGGAPIWTESRSAVPVTSGTFSVVLGSVTPLAGLNLNQQLYLGVTKGSDPEFSPRTGLTSSPSSLAPWSINGNNISFANGNVGIGTSTPNQQLEITGNLRLPQSTATTGIIYSGSTPFIHNAGIENFFAGQQAGSILISGYHNTGVGGLTLNAITSGFENTAGGHSAMYWNSSGYENTAYGSVALYDNTTGVMNTAVGFSAMFNNTYGAYNVAVGDHALDATTGSQFNTACGYTAGDDWDNGYNNVFVGALTDVNGSGYYNVIAMGEGTVVAAPSTARFGNSATVSYGGWANWTNVSDGRFKKNIKENVPGIEFISRLRPITYTLDATGMEAFLHKNHKHTLTAAARDVQDRALREKERIVYTGFVAQEVEAAARAVGFDFSGVDAPKNGNDYYGLRYAEFVVPLVKAVQEQQKMIDELKQEIRELRHQR